MHRMPTWMPSSGLEPPRLSAQALNLLRIPFRHEGFLRRDYAKYITPNLQVCQLVLGPETGLSHSKKLNKEKEGKTSWPIWPTETKKESFSCTLKKNTTTRKLLYGLFYLNTTSSGHRRGRHLRPNAKK